MYNFTLAALAAILFLAGCAPATPATQGPDATMVALKATLAAEATAAAAAQPPADQTVLPCSLGQDLAWRYVLIPALPMSVGNAVFTVDSYSVAVNVEGLGPWQLEFGYPNELGPFTGLCFILSGENIVMVEGAYYVPQPTGAQPLP